MDENSTKFPTALPAAAKDPPTIFEQLMTIARVSALEEMASGFAHEINQPLGAIATYAQAGERMLARPEPMVTAATDVMRQISAEALNAGEGIKRIRRLFNRESTQRERCSIKDLINELLPLLQFLVDRVGVRLDLDISNSVPDVVIDRRRIQHVLFTLVQNALEASREIASATIKLAISNDRYSVEISVSDQGKGVNSEAEKHMFRPFFTTKTNGTGLGLASSRAIVELHEGTIGYSSTSNGTRFWFTLPAVNES